MTFLIIFGSISDLFPERSYLSRLLSWTASNDDFPLVLPFMHGSIPFRARKSIAGWICSHSVAFEYLLNTESKPTSMCMQFVPSESNFFMIWELATKKALWFSRTRAAIHVKCINWAWKINYVNFRYLSILLKVKYITALVKEAPLDSSNLYISIGFSLVEAQWGIVSLKSDSLFHDITFIIWSISYRPYDMDHTYNMI